MTNNQFITTLSNVFNYSGDKERQVEAAFNQMFQKFFPGIQISNPFKCDGYFETEIEKNGKKEKLRVLIEYKSDYDMKNKVIRSRVLCQCLFYLKRFEKAGKPFPQIIFVGDVNECFMIHANDLVKFLDFEGVDWDKAASSASENAELLSALSNDENRNAYVFDIDQNFKFKDVYEKMLAYAANTVRLIRITEHNIDKVCGVFEKIVKDKKVSANDMVAYFIGCITNKDEYYLHPSKKNCLVVPNGKTVRVDSGMYAAFMNHFASSYSPKEIDRMAALSDRLIEDTNRRRKGEFYTPTPFVDKAHQMISEKFGEDWKEKYVVWDCACGTKNLTRDYKFKELYCSTLEQAELDISKQYNPEAVSFVFDFLNDPLEKLPAGLLDALKSNKPILFFINPPYANSGGMMGEGNGFGKTSNIRNEMLKNKISAEEIYAQFLYRIAKIKEQFGLQNCELALFCNPKFLTGESFKDFREYFLNQFKFENGIIFQASNFADVSSAWGITFNIWSNGISIDKDNFNHEIIEVDEGELKIVGNKTLYNLDNSKKYVSCIDKLKKTEEFPNWRKALSIDESCKSF